MTTPRGRRLVEGCRGDDLPEFWWRDRDILKAEIEAHDGRLTVISAVHGGPSTRALSHWRGKLGLAQLRPGPRASARPSPDDEWLIQALRKAGDRATVEALADIANVPPRRVREAAERLRGAGFRVDVAAQSVELHRVAPDLLNLHPDLLSGRQVLVGVVSDTHLGSREEALAELHLAYDTFSREGVTEVFHAGDISCGLGVFRGQAAEVAVHTLDEAVSYAAENYPKVPGIRTLAIGGNHDLEGDAGRVGLDISSAVALRRDDFEYLGAYSAWVGMHGGSWVHLLHGKGGMSYSVSYKAQKLVDGYPPGRKPAVLVVGHWHVRGSFEARGVEVLFPGCFEWQSRFLQRLGLQPAVGFHTLEMTFGDDGSLVRFLPRWFRFHEGRVIG